MASLGCIIVLIVTTVVGADVYSSIPAGAGYSTDKQQIVPQRCYNAKVASISDQEGYAQLGAAQSSSALEKVLGVSVSASGSFGAFSAEAKADYMRSVEENDYSISLNYYQYARNKVTIQLLDHGEKAIIENFRSYYDGGNNPYFGLMCGDHYVGSYLQGSVLTMNMKIEFSSSMAKTEFEAKVGASFGDIASASVSVKNAVSQYNIKGSVAIQAFQIGGVPSQLGNILSSSDSSEYFALACSLTAMDKCIKAAGGLLDYAKNKFPNQFSTESNTGLTPLGIAFSELIPIMYIGLKTPPSLVTPEVEQSRNALFIKLKENEYYQQKLHPFVTKGYPVELDGDFLKKATSVLSKANKNVDILMRAHGGAADCYNFPEKCISVKAKIYSQLQNITANDLKFLEPLKYILTIRGGMLYRGIGPEWRPVPDIKPGKEAVMVASSVVQTEEEYSYYSAVWSPSRGDSLLYAYHHSKPIETSPDGSITYSGILWSENPYEKSNNYREYKRISPFYFDVFDDTKQSHLYKKKK